MGHLITDQKLDRSTLVDKGYIVPTVFNSKGADIRMKRGDWPKVTEQERETYEPAVLSKLFGAMIPELRQTVLGTDVAVADEKPIPATTLTR